MVGGEEDSLFVRPESTDRIRRGELETEPDDSVLDRCDSALSFSETTRPCPRDELLSREDDSAAGAPWLFPKLEGRICGCMDMVLEGVAF
jgi:hypothetical protein